jgi:CDP-paratose 2-epimerase
VSTSHALVNPARPDRSHDEDANRTRLQRPVIVTGGAGFIGTNLVNRLLSNGERVIVFDDLSRQGASGNLQFLASRYGKALEVKLGDVRNLEALTPLLGEAASVFHFAAQVAVTKSIKAPLEDFEVNAHGTLQLLEALKSLPDPPPLLFTSTNKVYGTLPTVALDESSSRFIPRDPEIQRRGLDESLSLNFHTPYGCSKGTADQYVLDYAKMFGLRTCVFRMSCIYGMYQRGNEDQGWVAHFVSCSTRGLPLTFYGNGKQVRDLLFIEDLIDAMILARDKIDHLSGRAFNIGGGPSNSVSLLELMTMLERMGIKRPHVKFDTWRLGDQRYYVSDTTRFRQATGWKPHVTISEGLQRLHAWVATA